MRPFSKRKCVIWPLKSVIFYFLTDLNEIWWVGSFLLTLLLETIFEKKFGIWPLKPVNFHFLTDLDQTWWVGNLLVNVLLETIFRKTKCYLTVKIGISLIAWTVTYKADNASHSVWLDLTGNTSEWPAILFLVVCCCYVNMFYMYIFFMMQWPRPQQFSFLR